MTAKKKTKVYVIAMDDDATALGSGAPVAAAMLYSLDTEHPTPWVEFYPALTAHGYGPLGSIVGMIESAEKRRTGKPQDVVPQKKGAAQ